MCCGSVLQCVAVCCSLLQYITACCSQDKKCIFEVCCMVGQRGAAWQCAAACCSVLHRDHVHNVVTMSCDDACGVLQCVALCCAVLQCVAMHRSKG